MVSIENEELLHVFTPLEDGAYSHRMYGKGVDRWFDMDDTNQARIDLWVRLLSDIQLQLNPILEEWGCKKSELPPRKLPPRPPWA